MKKKKRAGHLLGGLSTDLSDSTNLKYNTHRRTTKHVRGEHKYIQQVTDDQNPHCIGN